MRLLWDNAGFMLSGLAQTFYLALATLAASTVVSITVGLMSVARAKVLRIIALCYVEFLRDIPLLVNLLFVYFGAPLLGIPLGPFAAAFASLTLWGGANGAEIVRGGLSAVPKHQTVSALALGLKSWETLWFVIGPQALLPILPSFTGLFTLLVQATSLASLVGVTEFFRIGQIMVERTTLQQGESPAFLVFGFSLLTYYAICAALTHLTRRLEQRLGRQARRGASLVITDRRAEESV